jgi:hypothetical protein
LEKLGLAEEDSDEGGKNALEPLEQDAVRAMIFKAVMQEDIRTLEKLLHVPGVDLNITNPGGYSPLGLANERGKLLACEWLIRHGAMAIP